MDVFRQHGEVGVVTFAQLDRPSSILGSQSVGLWMLPERASIDSGSASSTSGPGPTDSLLHSPGPPRCQCPRSTSHPDPDKQQDLPAEQHPGHIITPTETTSPEINNSHRKPKTTSVNHRGQRHKASRILPGGYRRKVRFLLS